MGRAAPCAFLLVALFVTRTSAGRAQWQPMGTPMGYQAGPAAPGAIAAASAPLAGGAPLAAARATPNAVRLPPGMAYHFSTLRARLHPDEPNPHMHVWRETLASCESEGADKCADVLLWLVNTLAGPDPKAGRSRFRELPRAKAPWRDWLASYFTDCPRLQKAGDRGASPEAAQCDRAVAAEFVKSGAGNSVLKLATAASVSWTAFFELPACLLVQMQDKCHGADCGQVLGWAADRCYADK